MTESFCIDYCQLQSHKVYAASVKQIHPFFLSYFVIFSKYAITVTLQLLKEEKKNVTQLKFPNYEKKKTVTNNVCAICQRLFNCSLNLSSPGYCCLLLQLVPAAAI